MSDKSYDKISRSKHSKLCIIFFYKIDYTIVFPKSSLSLYFE